MVEINSVHYCRKRFKMQRLSLDLLQSAMHNCAHKKGNKERIKQVAERMIANRENFTKLLLLVDAQGEKPDLIQPTDPAEFDDFLTIQLKAIQQENLTRGFVVVYVRAVDVKNPIELQFCGFTVLDVSDF